MSEQVLPKNWTEKQFSAIIQKVKSVNPRKNPNVSFKYVDVSGVSRSTFKIEKIKNLLGKDAPSRARRQIKNGDILFATIRPTL